MHAPIKRKFLRANHVPYLTKTLRKAIMKRSELENKYVKNKTNEKQRNFCSKLYKKERKKYYEMLDLKNVTDNKEFWKTVKPFLSDKVTTFPKISLVEKGEIISDESKVANSFSNFFENAIRSLGIKANEYSHENYDLKNPAEIVIKKFEQHSRTNLIDKNITNNENLPADHENILKEIINLDYKKMKHLKTFLHAASRMVRCVLSCPRKYL